MEPERDAPEDLSYLRASIEERVHRSARLIDGARRQARTQRDTAAAAFGRAEQQFTRSMQQTSAEYDAVLHGNDQSRADILQSALKAASLIYPGSHAVSVTTVSNDDTPALRYATAAHTGGAATADAAQYALEEGPCLEAIELDYVTVIGADDLTNRDPAPWPRFNAAARHLGISSAISIGIPWTNYWTGPIDPDRPPVGAINIYAATPYEFFAKETKAILLGVHVGARLTGADPAELYDPASMRVDRERPPVSVPAR